MYLVSNFSFIDKDRDQWHIELGLSQKKLGFLCDKVSFRTSVDQNHHLFILTFHAVSEAYDCVSILRLFQYHVEVQGNVTLPTVLPAPNSHLPTIPERVTDILDTEPEEKTSFDLNTIGDKELGELIEKIRNHPQYSVLLQRVRSLIIRQFLFLPKHPIFIFTMNPIADTSVSNNEEPQVVAVSQDEVNSTRQL